MYLMAFNLKMAKMVNFIFYIFCYNKNRTRKLIILEFLKDIKKGRKSSCSNDKEKKKPVGQIVTRDQLAIKLV